MPSTTWMILTLLAATNPVPNMPSPPAKLEFPLAGYRINALDSSSTNVVCGFMMSLPVTANSGSAQVMVSRFPPMDKNPSLQKWMADSKSFHAHNGDTILLERAVSTTESRVEYTTKGDKAGRKDHAYDRTLFANGVTYEIEATAPETQWKDVGPKLKACVDSFDLSPDPAPGKTAFPQQGYRISALDGATPVDAWRPLIMMPGGVFVAIQPYAKTIRDYQAERKPPMLTDPKHKFKILEEGAPTENALVTEYAEEIPADKKHPQGSQALSYEKVFLAHGQLYRAAGRLDISDPKSMTLIKSCVESLEAIPVPPAQ